VLIESVGTTPAQIVVERAMYANDDAGVVWAAGTNAVATKLAPLPLPVGYLEQPSYAGDCGSRPPGTTCIGYSDGYTWFVYDSIFGWTQGGSWDGRSIEIAQGYSADYYHILHTLYVKTVAK
jgi:hypothetical protein